MNNPFDLIDTRLSNIETILLDLKHNVKIQGNITEPSQWFDLNELRNYLPDKPSKMTVYGWVRNKSIPYHKGAKKLRFLKSEIDAWLRNGKKERILTSPEFVIEDLIKTKGGKK